MDFSVALRSVIPLLALMGAGLLSRRLGFLKAGDERVLNAYVYYFALPALFVVDLSETHFTGENMRFVAAGLIPTLVIAVLFWAAWRILRFARSTLHLLIVSTVFGSLAFFGLPFVMFAFPDAGMERLSVLSASSISAVSVGVTIFIMELHQMERTSQPFSMRTLAARFLQNPLIISIIIGSGLSLAGLTLPVALSRPLHMLGQTTATVALFMLGVFFYGRAYGHLTRALLLSLMRILLLPLLALAVAQLLGIHGIQRSVLVLMHAMPSAVSLIVLSERYEFHPELIASLVLVSSLLAVVHLNVWLHVLLAM